MNKSIRCLLIAAAFLVGGVYSSGPFAISADQTIPVSIALPTASLDLTDLDLRDASNRPIESAAARQRMESLFITGLNHMLLMNLTPGRRQVLATLASAWDIAAGIIKRAFANSFSHIKAWWQERKIKKIRFSESFGCLGLRRWPSNDAFEEPSGTPFLFLTEALLSSTHILR